MPHVVDPFRAGFVRHGFGIDAICCEALLENGVREAEIRALAVVESVVGVCHVVMSPAELRRVESNDTSREPRLMGAREQRDRQLVIMRLIQLEKPRSLPISSAYVLYRLTASRGQAVRQIQFFGDFGDGQFARGVIDFVNPNGREADGRGDFVSENCGCCVAGVGVDEHARDYAVAVEGLAVGEVGC